MVKGPVAIFLAGAVLSMPALARPLYRFEDLALAPAGDPIATVDSAAEPDATSAAHGTIVVRATAGGRVIERVDPCKTCSYSGLAFGPRGELAYLVRDRAKGTVTLRLAGDRADRPLATTTGWRTSRAGRRTASASRCC